MVQQEINEAKTELNVIHSLTQRCLGISYSGSLLTEAQDTHTHTHTRLMALFLGLPR